MHQPVPVAAGVPAGTHRQPDHLDLGWRQLGMVARQDLARVDQPVSFLTARDNGGILAAGQSAERQPQRHLHHRGALDDQSERVVPLVTDRRHRLAHYRECRRQLPTTRSSRTS
jgi:hypothetical protein